MLGASRFQTPGSSVRNWGPTENLSGIGRLRLAALPPECAYQPSTHLTNFYEAQQQPLYYWLFSVPLRFITHWHLWPRVLLIRLLSRALASLAIPLAYLAAGEALGFWCAALIAVAPGFAIDVCRVANDSLAIALTALLFLLMVRRAGGIAVGAVLGLALLAKAYLLVLLPAVLLRRRSVCDLAPAALIAGWWYVRNVMLGLPFTGWIQHADTAQAIAAIVHIQWLRVMQVIGNTFIWFSAWSFLTLKAWMYALVEIIAVGAGMVAGVSAWRRRDAALNTAFACAGCFALATLYGVRVGYSIQKIAAVPGWYAWSIVTALAVILASGLGRATIAMVAVLALIDIYGVVARLTPFYAGLVDRHHAAVLRFPEALTKLHIPPVLPILWLSATLAIPVLCILFRPWYAVSPRSFAATSSRAS